MGSASLFTGTLNLLVLRAVEETALHGYGIGRWIRERSDGALGVEEGQLYPALHRLERRGLLRAEWGRTETNRRAKFYRITAAGRRALETEESSWQQYAEAVQAVLGREP